MSRIKVIQHNEATGRLLEIYNNLVETRGKLAEVHKIQSLRPESIVKHMDLYLEIMFTKSELSRAEREMMAVIVSVNNGCEYCRLHHAEALNHYWKNDEQISKLITDFNNVELNNRQLVLCQFAKSLTLNPESFSEPTLIDKIKGVGISDAAILDATLVIAYFNFVNRIVLALGVESNVDETKGYNH
ncbi:MAG: peroxidase [Bacteroidetes bacterium HGW-Bacteroidetes-4]|jgi:uncharacterized peroxidase-related enzyme|nr:MAG: peroxidase [Bacteroidetes bacterium HGW-Bacteroidetes-4]